MKKLALVVGHNSVAQGAVRSDGVSEFQFNSRVAKLAQDYAHKAYPDLEVRVFFRQAGLGYRKEIERVYEETDRWGASLTNELHFNSHSDPSAHGAEILSSGTASSFKFAQITQDMLVGRMGMRDRGVKTRKTGRGSESLMSGKAPAILSEPFFGSSSKDKLKFDEWYEEEALAELYIDAAAQALAVLPRQNLEESRTLQKVEQQKRLAKLGKAGAGTTLVTGTLDQTSLLEAVSLGKTLESALPWLAGSGLIVALAALYGIPWLAEYIEQFRREDADKELR